MSQFLKLSKIIINTNHIRNINVLSSKYEIILSTPNISGYVLAGSGKFDLNFPTINVCEKENNEDYNTIKNWITIQYYNSK
jgi:hypothetical protein